MYFFIFFSVQGGHGGPFVFSYLSALEFLDSGSETEFPQQVPFFLLAISLHLVARVLCKVEQECEWYVHLAAVTAVSSLDHWLQLSSEQQNKRLNNVLLSLFRFHRRANETQTTAERCLDHLR